MHGLVNREALGEVVGADELPDVAFHAIAVLLFLVDDIHHESAIVVQVVLH